VILTEKSVEKLRPDPNKRLQYADDQQRGFGIRVEPTGRRRYFYYGKVGAVQVFKSLGEFPATSVKEARDAATELAGRAQQWKRENLDPEKNPFRRPAKMVRTTTPLFRELVEAYIERHIQRETLHPVRAKYELKNLVKNHLSQLEDLPIDKITVDHVLAAKNKAKGSYIQNSIVELTRRLFNWSSGKGPTGKLNFWRVTENPAKDIGLNKREKRRRFLQAEELVRFHEALKKEPHRDTRDILTLLLATGARKQNVYEMQWADVSFELSTWTIPMSKSGESYVVELTPAAIAVLEGRSRGRDEKSKWIFPANSSSGHVADIKKRWALLRKRAGIGDVRLHDLRRTKGSWAAISGESLQKIGAMLGHKSQGATEIYAQLNQDSIRRTSLASDSMMDAMMAEARKRMKAAARKTPKLLAVRRG
jgi:integrase